MRQGVQRDVKMANTNRKGCQDGYTNMASYTNMANMNLNNFNKQGTINKGDIKQNLNTKQNRLDKGEFDDGLKVQVVKEDKENSLSHDSHEHGNDLIEEDSFSEEAERVCCPTINKEEWDMKEFVWNNKAFYTGDLRLFFNMPVGMKWKIGRMKDDLIGMGYELDKDIMVLHRPLSPYKAKLMIAISNPEFPGEGEIDGNVEFLSGKFIAQYYEGPYTTLKNAMKRFEDRLKIKKGRRPLDMFMWRANCKKCAENKGVPLTVFIAKMEELDETEF